MGGMGRICRADTTQLARDSGVRMTQAGGGWHPATAP